MLLLIIRYGLKLVNNVIKTYYRGTKLSEKKKMNLLGVIQITISVRSLVGLEIESSALGPSIRDFYRF